MNESTAPTAAESAALLLIARNLKAARTRARLSQRALGELVHLDKSAICRYESGSRLPTILTMVAISRALGRPDFELFPGWDASGPAWRAQEPLGGPLASKP